MNALFPEVSVIVVSWNTVEMLRKCLLSLYAGVKELSLEVIVVDNGSTDGSVEMCEKNFPGVRLIRNRDNLGFGRANNQGILASKAELVLLLNSDTIVLRGSIEKMMKRMNEDSSVGVLGCRLIRPGGSYQPSCMNFPSLKIIFVERLLLYKLSAKLPRTTMEPPYIVSRTKCDYVSGACMLVRKAAVQAIGLFDPRIFMYGEELDLCYRAKVAGWEILFEPGAEVVHVGSGSWREKRYSSTLPKMLSLLEFCKGRFPPWKLMVVRLLCLIGIFLRIFLWGTLALWRRNERARALLEVRTNYMLLRETLARVRLPGKTGSTRDSVQELRRTD